MLASKLPRPSEIFPVLNQLSGQHQQVMSQQKYLCFLFRRLLEGEILIKGFPGDSRSPSARMPDSLPGPFSPRPPGRLLFALIQLLSCFFPICWRVPTPAESFYFWEFSWII